MARLLGGAVNIYVLQSCGMGGDGEQIENVEGVYTYFKEVIQAANELEKTSTLTNPPQYSAEFRPLGTRVVEQRFLRRPDGVWEMTFPSRRVLDKSSPDAV